MTLPNFQMNHKSSGQSKIFSDTNQKHERTTKAGTSVYSDKENTSHHLGKSTSTKTFGNDVNFRKGENKSSPGYCQTSD